jgi:WD40 repeat protein
VLVWDVATGEHTVISGGLAGARLLAYSPNGTHLAVSSSGQHLWICEIAARECDALDGHGTTVTSLFFAQNALVTTSGDGTMRVWDVATGESRVYRGHDAAVFEAGITPDGAQLVTGSGDTTVRVWSFGLPPHPRDLPRLLADLTDARVVEVSPRGGDRTRFVR